MAIKQNSTARGEMIGGLREMQNDLLEAWIDRSLPVEWDGLDTTQPMAREKERVTIRLDADMVRWFRKLGPGYGARINAVLRIYWSALVSGRIRAHWDEETVSPNFEDFILRLAEAREARKRESEGA